MITRSRMLCVTGTALTLLLAAPAQAKEKSKFYVGGATGLVFAGNTRGDGIFRDTGSNLDGQQLGPAPKKTVKGNFDPSFTTNAIIGYDMGTHPRIGRFRLEGELFYQQANTDKYSGVLNGTRLEPPGRVDTTTLGIMTNIVYDRGAFSNVTPYFYSGYGWGRVDTEYDFPGRGRVSIDGSSQVIQAGFGFEIPYNKRTKLDFKYRFRRTGLNEGGLDVDIDAQAFEFGIRYDL